MILEIFIEYLKISVLSAILILVVLSVSPFIGKHFRKTWRLSIWIIIGLASAFPAGLISVLFGQTKIFSIAKNSVVANSPELERFHYNLPVSGDYSFSDIVAASEPTALYSIINTIPQWIAFVWIVGMLIQALMILVRYIRFNRVVFEHSCPLEKSPDIPFLKGKEVSVFVNTYLPSSITTGILHPRIIMETGDFDSEEFNVVFYHECMHIRRRDLWKKLLFQIILVIHWYNPVIRKLPHLAGNDIELCCDESVLKYYGKEYCNTYAAILGKLAIDSYKSSFSEAMGFNSDQNIVMTRLEAIYDNNDNNNKSIKGLAVLLSVIFVILTCFIGHSIHGSVPLTEVPGFQGYYDSAIAEWDNLSKEIREQDVSAAYSSDIWHNHPVKYCADNGLIKPHVIYGHGFAALYYGKDCSQWHLQKGGRINITVSFDNSFSDSTGVVVWGYIKDNQLPDPDSIMCSENTISYMDPTDVSTTEFIVPETGDYSFYALKFGDGPQYVNWVRISF